MSISARCVAYSLFAALVVDVSSKGTVGQGADPDPAGIDLFVSGRNGYHTYRIPALIETTKGTLLAFCEGRKTGRADDATA